MKQWIAVIAVLGLTFLPALAEEQPANLTRIDLENNTTLPINLFKGRVTNQASRYILGPGDTLSIKIQDLERFNQTFNIRPDGYATIHPLGEFYVAGTDVQGLESWLKERFKFYLVNPTVTVNIDELRPATVYMTGAVQKPGTYQFAQQGLHTQNLNEKTQPTLTNALAKAGGVGLYADISNIEVIHAVTGQRETFDLREFLTGDGTLQDIWLLPEDTVKVSESKQPMDSEIFKLISNSTFYKKVKFPVVILGAVHQQGEVQIDPDNNSLTAAIALAGGFATDVSKRHPVTMQRADGKGGFTRWVVKRKQANLELLPGDVVYVSGSSTRLNKHGLWRD